MLAEIKRRRNSASELSTSSRCSSSSTLAESPALARCSLCTWVAHSTFMLINAFGEIHPHLPTAVWPHLESIDLKQSHLTLGSFNRSRESHREEHGGASAGAACENESAVRSYWMSDNGLGWKAHIVLTTHIAEVACDARRQNRETRAHPCDSEDPKLCNLRLDFSR